MVGEVQSKCNKVSRLIQVPIHGLFADSHNSSCHGAIGVAIGVISVSGLSSSVHVWPSDMDIQFVPGTTHVLLTIQGTLMKTVLQDGFKRLQASMLFEHAFPDVVLAYLFICDVLIITLVGSGPTTTSICPQMLNDKTYIKKLSPLVHMTTLLHYLTDPYCH